MNKKTIKLFVPLVLFNFSAMASAASISAEANTSYLFNGTPTTVNDSNSSLGPNVTASAAINFADRATASASQSGNLNAFSTGDDTIVFNTQSNATAKWEQTVTNNSGATSSYRMDFSPGKGSISLGSHTDPGTGKIGSGTSGYSVEVLLNGSSIWTSSAQISEIAGSLIGASPGSTRSVYAFSKSGVDLAGTLNLTDWTFGDQFVDGSYKFTKNDYKLDLGKLLDGETLTVTYLLHSFTNSINLGNTRIGENSYAKISPSAVPIPASILLFLSGIMVFSQFRLKKNQT
jgi:hypothetical protein